LPIAAIVALMIALRVALLAAEALPFNGDEAIVALMARHIRQGERPAFFYGQAYLGSTDAWLVSIAFSFFGESVSSIRLVQIALFAGTLITTYFVARRFGLDERAARLSTLLMALPPTLLTLYTTATLGGYGETLLFGNLLILSALTLGRTGSGNQLQRHQATRSLRAFVSLWLTNLPVLRWLAFGLLAGFAFWTFGLILVYLIPLVLWLTWRHRLRAWRSYAVAALGFVLSSAPWWASIAQLGGSLIGELTGSAIANTVAAPTLLGSLGVRLVNFFVFGLSAWLGLRYPWSPEIILPPIGIVVAAVYLGAFAFAIWRGPRLAWGMIGTLLLTYLLTPFGGDPSGRYFLPLHLPLSILTALFVGYVRDALGSRLARWVVSGLAGLLVALIIGYNVAGSLLAAAQQPPGITTQFDAVTWIDRHRDRELIDFLLSHGETRGYTNYWVAYPIAFLSGERIISAARLPYHLDFRYTRRDDRYLPYAQMVAESPRAFYITTNHPALDALIRERLVGLGVALQEETIGSYHIFYDLSRKVEPEDLGINER
jgi:4-amino-4-deoxy-L-arabinose transferase-like glycosyltransferase